jgi:alpha-D-xyloside xylohydrolase
MRKRVRFCYILLLGIISSCGTNTVERLSDGVIIRPGTGVKQVRLQVVNDKTIRVTATNEESFSTRKSLMITPGLEFQGSWTLDQFDDVVSLTTASLHAEVNLKTGEVIFKDSTGQVLLRERTGGGKELTPITVEGEQAYRIRQVFESLEDEAFYGLGGHQNGQMNYKGQDVELVQHNIVAVVPFLYSSRNYGILWDNYSISRFGDPREYEPLRSLKLYTEDGEPGGFTTRYYVKDKVVKTVVEDEIAYEYLETPQVDNFPKDVSKDGKVTWKGSFSSEKDGAHKFLVYASGYFKVWIDGKLVLDRWRQNWNPWTDKFTVNIINGEKHSINIEWIPQDGGYMAVKHLDPLGVEEQNQLSLFSEVGDEIDYYFIHGDNADDVISGYRTLTGKAPIPPKWAFGFWQSRERYTSQNELMDVVKEYRKRRIPIDNIVLDWQYWEDPQWGSHEFDPTRFPDPKGMVDALHKNYNANIMISVWPKFNKGTKNFEEMNKRGFLFTTNIEKKRKDWVGIGYESTFYDPFNEEAGELFWDQIDTKLHSLGFDAWWLDATEPDMHSNLSIEARINNMTPTALGPGARYFNAYSLVNSKSVYEGQRRSDPNKRVFILTRSAYAGQQRYAAATWSGDVASRWTDFGIQIAAGVNFSMSGIPYWTMDIGGFSVETRYYNPDEKDKDEWQELNTRWFQFGAFCPLFRSHGQYPYREIFNIAPEGTLPYETMVYYTKLRYQLMPYLYSLAGHTYFNDYTIMRGLVMDFGHDPGVRNIADQYMLGPALLVNPVHEYKQRVRSVYLPEANAWYDLYSGKYFEGATTQDVATPLDRMPVFVRSGSIIPFGPQIQSTSEKLEDILTIYVYTGEDGSFDLYEDEGINYNYEKGKYAVIPMRYRHAERTLTIGRREGSFDGVSERKKIKVIWVTPDRPVGVDSTVKIADLIEYTGDEIVIPMKQ